MILHLWLLGLVSMLAQVIILRELAVTFYGVELVYILSIGMWLVGSGIGAWSGRWGQISSKIVPSLFLLLAWLLVLEVAYLRGLHVLFGGVPGAFLSLGRQLTGMSAAVTPTSFVLGLIFALTARQFMAEGGSLAAAYAMECAGAAVGGVAATLTLPFGISNLTTGVLCALMAMVPSIRRLYGSAVQGGSCKSHLYRLQCVLVSVLVGALFAMLIFARELDLHTTRWNVANAISVRDTPYGRVTVAKQAGQISVYQNGAVCWENEGTVVEELAHPAALQVESLNNVLLLGGAVDGTLGELLKHQPRQIDVIEIDRRMLDAVRPHLPEWTKGSLADERVRLIIGDPRRLLPKLRRYDLVVVALADPASAQSNRFYTREFFNQVRERLSFGGVLGFRLRSAENYWSDPLTARNAAIVAAAQSMFADVVVLPGSNNVVLASGQRLTREVEILQDRFRTRRLHPRLVSAEYLRYLYTTDRFFEVASRLQSFKGPINSDDRPVCFLHSVTMWLAKFYPRMITSDLADLLLKGTLRDLGIVASIITGLLFIIGRGYLRMRFAALTAVAGFAGVVSECSLILHYQVTRGVLYRDLGLLLTLFMLGMSLGAYGMHLYARRPPAAHSSCARQVRVEAAFVTTFALGCLLFAWGIGELSHLPSPVVGLGLVLTGGSVAVIFAYAGDRMKAEPQWAAASLYAADLFGGAVGTVIGTLLIIPLFGLAAALMVAGISVLLALLLI